MELPDNIRDQFRQFGQRGGKARAIKLGAQQRRTIARKAATARWINSRFGSTTFKTLGLPGGELVDTGLADLADGRVTLESLLVSLAAARLRREGVPLGNIDTDPEQRLYDLLLSTEGEFAHARYNAYRQSIVSFANACARVRIQSTA